MLLACRITNATYTHLKYVIFIAFPQEKWFRERASMLRYMCIVCLFFFILSVHCDCVPVIL
jgi:hypothetical protein